MVVGVVPVGQLEVELVADQHFGNDAEALQELQGAVYRRQIDVRVLLPGQVPDFVDADVVALAGNDVKHRKPLRSHSITLRAQHVHCWFVAGHCIPLLLQLFAVAN